ncbi:MAG: DUF2281 domain-containing protein [Pseudanabaena sp.]|jgi:hypothetical protein
MTTKERLIQELINSPEELVEELMDFLLFVRSRRSLNQDLQQSRPYGLCTGEFTVPENFDDPLPDDVLQDFEYPL